MVPTFTLEHLDGVGAKQCPCSVAMVTLQNFAMASRPTTSIGRGVSRKTTTVMQVRTTTQPKAARFGAGRLS